MKKYMLAIGIVAISCFTLIACSSDKNEESKAHQESKADQKSNEGGEQINIPKNLIEDADTDPIEIKDQMGLTIGETGYAGRYIAKGELAITLNGVEKTQAISENETMKDDEFFLIGDFTFENVSNDTVEVIRPDAVKASDESAVINDEFDNGDLLGVGQGLGGDFVNDNNKIPDDGIINTVSLEPGEKIDQKISISMRGKTDEYLIVFGFFDGNNRYYRNKVAWKFDHDQLKGE